MSANPMTAEHEKAGVLPEDVQKLAKETCHHFGFDVMPRPFQPSREFWAIANAILADRASRPSPSAIEGGSSGLTRGTAQRAEGGWKPRVKALKAALDRVAYRPGDHPVIPVKYARFEEEVRDIIHSAELEDIIRREHAALGLPDPDADPKAVDAAAQPLGGGILDDLTAAYMAGVERGKDLARSIEPGKDEERLREARAYRCPSCGIGDPSAYIRCHRSDCPDGRDERPAALSPSRGEADTSQDRAAAQTDAKEPSL